MKILLDTHAFIWWLFDDPKLSRVAKAAIARPAHDVYVSAASVCEIAIKLSINKLPLTSDLNQDLFATLAGTDFPCFAGYAAACVCGPISAMAPPRSV